MYIDYPFLFIIFIIGASVGSFLNLVAYRSIHGGKIITTRSACTSCKHTLSYSDLVPIFSFLLLKGKCRYCGKPISWQYPLVEAATGLVFIVSALTTHRTSGSLLEPSFAVLPNIWGLFFTLFVASVFIVLFVTDLKDGLIPDRIIFLSIIAAFFYKLSLVAISLFQQNPVNTFYDFGASLLLAFLFAGFFYAAIWGTSGKAMGGGDVKYAFFIGLALGWPAAVVGFFLAFLTGAGAAVMLILTGYKRFGQTVPFGPFLSIGGLISLFWGQQLFNWYVGLF